MLNKRLSMGVAAMAAVVALTFAVAVSPAAAAGPGPVAPTVAVAAAITPEEEAGLTHMREEEKLARDVYQYLYQMWTLPVFSNIAASEQTHMNAIKTLLDRYRIADPAAGNGAGVFTNPDLQALYDQLIFQGSQSSAAALQVGVAIEKLDITDLQEQLTLTSKLDITTVYQNLLNGSQNHLRAFTTNLQRYAR